MASFFLILPDKFLATFMSLATFIFKMNNVYEKFEKKNDHLARKSGLLAIFISKVGSEKTLGL